MGWMSGSLPCVRRWGPGGAGRQHSNSTTHSTAQHCTTYTALPRHAVRTAATSRMAGQLRELPTTASSSGAVRHPAAWGKPEASRQHAWGPACPTLLSLLLFSTASSTAARLPLIHAMGQSVTPFTSRQAGNRSSRKGRGEQGESNSNTSEGQTGLAWPHRLPGRDVHLA